MLICWNVTSQTDSTKNVRYFGIPVFFRTPELGYAGGLSGTASFKTSFYNDSLTRTSIIQVLGFFTSRQVNAQGINANIFFPKEKQILLFQTTHQYFPDKFWGIGPNTQTNSLSNYIFESINAFAHFKHKVSKHLYLGALADYQNVYKIKYDLGSSYDTSNFIGKKPYETTGIGLSLTYDTRNNTFWPDKGLFLLSQFLYHQKGLISAYTFNKLIIDTRFFKLIFPKQILAMQLYSYNTFGNTPIRDLATLGGAGNLRGIYQGRYRAKNMFSFITEYRYNFYKRFSTVVFGGFGTVYNQQSEIILKNLKPNVGAGLRFSLLKKEKMNLRLDYGYSSKDDQTFYFTITECF